MGNTSMPADAAQAMKARLRADLLVAMKARRGLEAKILRALVAAIDNAQAPPARSLPPTLLHHDFHAGSAEVERLCLSRADLRQVLLAEIDERERAAAELESLKQRDRAEALRVEALVARRYLA